jgi:DNA-binding beta-propeller fold protein YncE
LGSGFFSGVVRIDPESDKVIARIPTRGEQLPVFATLKSIAVTSSAVWLGASGSKINPGANVVVDTALDGVDVPLAADPNTVWSWPFQTGRGWSQLVGVDARTNEVTHQIQISGHRARTQVAGIAVGARSIWAVGQEGGRTLAWRASLRTDKIVKGIVLPGFTPSAVTFGDGRFWFLDTVGGTARSIDPRTNRVSPPVALPGNPTNLAAGARALWVIDASAGQLYQVPLGSGIQVIEVGKNPIAVAVGDGAVWVVNHGDGTVSKIDPVGGTVLDTIRVAPPSSCTIGQGGRCHGIFDVAIGAGGVWVAESAGQS